MPDLEEGLLNLREADGATVRVVVAGDTCPQLFEASAVPDILSGRGPGILRGVAPFLDDADLRVVQWEVVLTDAETPIDKTGPNLKVPPACAALAVQGRFDVALLANNHAGDYGPETALATRAHLERRGVATVGMGADLQEAVRPLSIERAGFRIGIVNIAENEYGLARPERAGGAPLDLPANLRAIARAADANDLVLVFLHGGTETFPAPSPRIVGTCRAFVEGGAHAVVCIHSHCPQGLEVYEGAPIVYCPGNFFFPRAPYNPSSFWWSGYLPKFTFDRRGAVSVEIEPYRFRPDPWRIEPLQGGQRTAFLRYLSELSELIARPGELRRLFEAWAAKRGQNLLKGICGGDIPWPKDLQDRAQVKAVLGLRNLLTCEAHHELLATALRLLEEFRFESALADWPRIETLQSAAFLAED